MEKFSFPYPPYEIQLKLMEEIEQCIDLGQIGIFESPTGTGKSLSVICSTMTWMERFEKEYESNLLNRCTDKKENIAEQDDWVEQYKQKKAVLKDVDEAQVELEKLNAIKRKIETAALGTSGARKRKFLNGVEQSDGTDVEDELIPQDDYCSDTEQDVANQDDDLKTVKIYYASRTHSQLEQLVDELSKTRFKPRIISAGSRKTLCANESVKSLKQSHLINERCMDLRKKSSSSKRSKNEEGKSCTKKSSCGCSYYSSDAIESLSNDILACRITKTSEVLSSGETMGACPYYSVRKALPLAQLVLLPYQVLFHETTRAAWGIDLKDCVVILDEAHNVLQTIGSLYSCELSDSSISLALKLVRQYIDTYSTRLKEKNLSYMRMLCNFLISLEKVMNSIKGSEGEPEDVCTVQNFIMKYGLYPINYFKLVNFMEATDLCKKFHGFFLRENALQVKMKEPKAKSGITKLMNKKKDLPKDLPTTSVDVIIEPRSNPSPLFSIKTFIESLNNPCDDGRIIVDRKTKRLRFILLNPADRLADVVRNARSTILVGGTMEPANLLIDCLTRGTTVPIRRFSCEHVIDDNQLLALSVGKLADGKPLTLTFQTRSDDSMLKSIAFSLVQLCCTVPNGCVAFFPSYDFLSTFMKKLQQFGLYDRLAAAKVVYVEPHGASSADIWEKFVSSARSKRGAILFAVVGGKLSEGINFSDDLGRAVFMIGLPYPNKNSVELKERMKFLDGKMADGGNMLYNSLCMHSVNQSIGRAIRHRKDYAAVFLLDQRFSKDIVRNQLSGWIARRLQDTQSLTHAVQLSKNFFAEKV